MNTKKNYQVREKQSKETLASKDMQARIAEGCLDGADFQPGERMSGHIRLRAALPAGADTELVASALTFLNREWDIAMIPVAKTVRDDGTLVLDVVNEFYQYYRGEITAETFAQEVGEALGGICSVRRLRPSVQNVEDAMLLRVYDAARAALRIRALGSARTIPVGYIEGLRTIADLLEASIEGVRGSYKPIMRYCVVGAVIDASRSAEDVAQSLNHIEQESEFKVAPYTFERNGDGSWNLTLIAARSRRIGSDYDNECSARTYFARLIGQDCMVRALNPSCESPDDMQRVTEFNYIRKRMGDTGRGYQAVTFTTRDLVDSKEQARRLCLDESASGAVDVTYAGSLEIRPEVDMHGVAQANELLKASTGIEVVPRYVEPDGNGVERVSVFVRKRGGFMGLSLFPVTSKDVDDIERYLCCRADVRPLKCSADSYSDIDLATEARIAFREGYGANSLAAWNREKPMDEPTAQEMLEELIGLESVKQQLSEIVAYASTYKAVYGVMPTLHAMFLGAPGTGKTTVARILCKMLGEAGVLDKPDRFIETDRHGLVSRYVGNSAHDTHMLVNRAMGGMLFVDEAYSLANDANSSHAFGKEAIDALVKRMEDDREYFVCVMAGYDQPMQRLQDLNPGLPSRIAFKLHFPNYSADELMAIFDYMLDDNVFSVTDAARKRLAQQFSRVADGTDEGFANARAVRVVVDRLQMRQLTNGGTKISAKTVDSVFADEDIAPLFDSASSFGFVA